MQKKIAYCGIEGAFANIAAKKIFPEGQLEPFPTFDKTYNSVVNGDCDFAVLPLENSFAGDVSQVFDLMFQGPLKVQNIHYFHISQTLLGTQDSTIEDVKTVISHQQAIDQSNEFIQQHGLTAIPVNNTAVAAKEVSLKNDKTVAAIASEETAALYNLKVLKKNINQNEFNTTRFAVFGPELPAVTDEKNCISLLMFTVKNKPGALAKTIRMIGKQGFNLTSIHSRPIKNVPWEYYFYTEVEGDLTSAKGGALLKKLEKHCSLAKVLGHFIK